MRSSLRVLALCAASAAAGLTVIDRDWFLAFGLCVAGLLLDEIVRAD